MNVELEDIGLDVGADSDLKEEIRTGRFKLGLGGGGVVDVAGEGSCEEADPADDEQAAGNDHGKQSTHVYTGITSKHEEDDEEEDVCPKCQSKSDPDPLVIQCLRCFKWYHWKCVGVNLDNLPATNEEWFCSNSCSRKKTEPSQCPSEEQKLGFSPFQEPKGDIRRSTRTNKGTVSKHYRYSPSQFGSFKKVREIKGTDKKITDNLPTSEKTNKAKDEEDRGHVMQKINDEFISVIDLVSDETNKECKEDRGQVMQKIDDESILIIDSVSDETNKEFEEDRGQVTKMQKNDSPISMKVSTDDVTNKECSSPIFKQNVNKRRLMKKVETEQSFKPLFREVKNSCDLCLTYKYCNSQDLNSKLEKSDESRINLCNDCSDKIERKVRLIIEMLELKLEHFKLAQPHQQEHTLPQNLETIVDLISKICPDQSHTLGIIILCGICGHFNWSTEEKIYFTSIISLYLEDIIPSRDKFSSSFKKCKLGKDIVKFFYSCGNVRTQINICEIIWFCLKKRNITREEFFQDNEQKLVKFKLFITNLQMSLNFEQNLRLFVTKENRRRINVATKCDSLRLTAVEFNDINATPSKTAYGKDTQIDINYKSKKVSLTINIDTEIAEIQIPFNELTLKVNASENNWSLVFNGGRFLICYEDLVHCKRLIEHIHIQKTDKVVKVDLKLPQDSQDSKVAHDVQRPPDKTNSDDQNSNNNDQRSEETNISAAHDDQRPIGKNNSHNQNSSSNDQGPEETNSSDDSKCEVSEHATITGSFFIDTDKWQRYWTPMKHGATRYLNRTETAMDFPRYYGSPCKVMIKSRNRVLKEGGRKHNMPWAVVAGHCTLCEAYHDWQIRDDPYQDGPIIKEQIKVEFEVTGKFLGDPENPDISRPDHIGKEAQSRQLRGIERQNMGRLASKLSSNEVFDAQMAFAREHEIESNNWTSVRNINQIHQAKYEQEKTLRGGKTQLESVRQFKELNENIYSTESPTANEQKYFGGYVRKIQEEPFRVTLWKYTQLKIAAKYLNQGSWKKPTKFYLDFTGNIWRDKDKIGRKILNGAIVIPPAVPKTSPLSVADWVSNSNTTLDCKIIFAEFFSDLQKANNHVRVSKPQVVIIDIAWHLVHSVTEEIVNTNVRTYLQQVYDYLVKAKKVFPYGTIVQFCKNHSLPAWLKSARGLGPNKIVADTFVAVMVLMAECKTWNDALVVYTSAVKMFASKFENEQASKVIFEMSKKNCGIPLKSLSKENNFFDDYLEKEKDTEILFLDVTQIEELPENKEENSSIRQQSPFFSFFESYFENLTREEEEVEVLGLNKMYAPQLIKWFQRNWLPLAPYFLRAILPTDENSEVLPLQTNAYVELWWQHLKLPYKNLSSSLMWPPRILTTMSDLIDKRVSGYLLHEKNPRMKLGKPKEKEPKKDDVASKLFKPTSTRGRKNMKQTASRNISQSEYKENINFTPTKNKRVIQKDNSSETKCYDTWDKRRGSERKGAKSNTKFTTKVINTKKIDFPEPDKGKATFFGRHKKAEPCDENIQTPKKSFVQEEDDSDLMGTTFVFSQNTKRTFKANTRQEETIKDLEENRIITIESYDGDKYSFEQDKLNDVVEIGSYIDSDVMEAGIGLLNRYLHDGKKDFKVMPICMLRLIWRMDHEDITSNEENSALGEFRSYLGGKKEFVTILPRFLSETKSGDAHHYTLISNLNCNRNSVRVFETLNAYRGTEKGVSDNVFSTNGWSVVTKLLGTQEGEIITVHMEDVEPQREAECGAISLALCYRLVFNGDSGPSNVTFKNCRNHLATCLRSNQLREFPTNPRTRELLRPMTGKFNMPSFALLQSAQTIKND